MRSLEINEGELRGQPANPGLSGKMAVKTECVCVCVCVCSLFSHLQVRKKNTSQQPFKSTEYPHHNCYILQP